MKSKFPQVYLQCHKPAVSLFYTAALSDKHCILPKAVWDCTGAGPLHTYMKIKSPEVYLQCQKSAVSLFRTAAISTAFCRKQCGTAVVMGHCTPV